MIYDLGIVIPVYHSTESVKQLVYQLEQLFLPDIRIRICLVDDSDDEKTAAYLKKNCLSPVVTLIILAGNHGQQTALRCGLEKLPPCRVYATIDDDLEQPPEILLTMYQQMLAGYDLVYGVPAVNKPGLPLYRRWGSRMRDRMFLKLLGAPPEIKVSSFRVMRDRVLKSALAYQHSGPGNGFFYLSAAIFKSMKNNQCTIASKSLYYQPDSRFAGTSGYSLGRLVKLYGNILWYYVLELPEPGFTGKGYQIKYVAETENHAAGWF